jgi:hypothetical protein
MGKSEPSISRFSLAAVAIEVQVSSGDPAVVEVGSAAIGANVSSREVTQLPINGSEVSS